MLSTMVAMAWATVASPDMVSVTALPATVVTVWAMLVLVFEALVWAMALVSAMADMVLLWAMAVLMVVTVSPLATVAMLVMASLWLVTEATAMAEASVCTVKCHLRAELH